MTDWIASFVEYALCNWQSLLVGGVIVVCSVIFLMGCFKNLFLNKIKHKLVRKIVLSFLSLVLVLPATMVIILYKGLSLDYFWVLYAMNSVGTILTYWLYENTGLRNLISLIGRNTVSKFFKSVTQMEDLEKTMEEISTDTKKMLKDSKYKEEDLKNL